MKLSLSVVICTHNPRRDYLDKVLHALKSQTLPIEQWELCLIDNASDEVLASEIDLSWHPQARHIREEQLGLTPARLRGIKEAAAETLVFVDDDNVLDSDYLEVALQISKDWPKIGAWGGQIRPDFEETPPDWTKPYWSMLAIREFDQDKWSNLLNHSSTAPCGAGICVRKVVARKYADLFHKHPKRAGMGRKGKLLLSCEDSDLALTACDIGLGTGQFTSLKLTHLIPAYRLQEDYLLRLVEGMTYSLTMLDSFRGKLTPKLTWQKKLLQHYHRWRVNVRQRRFYDASQRGLALAIKEITSTRE
ncbi:glycosyltransferase [Allocoleopsis sp.]|uniref:glycosyltransferase n=1 Tax=Allocoleopsis sp. TaxID=3088169 RepID=UPI002FD6884B